MTAALLLSVLWGLLCGLCGATYSVALPLNGFPAAWWFNWLDRWYYSRSLVKSSVGAIPGGCEKCFSGQLALWSSSVVVPWSLDALSIAVHASAASCAILSASAIGAAYRWMNNRI